jgi:RNA polymerase sigma factor (sigma-70 family)
LAGRAATVAGAHGTADAADAIAVRDALDALPERQRGALVLRYFSDLPVAEVAAIMGCPEGTVKTLTARAIASLRKAGLVDDQEPEGALDAG